MKRILNITIAAMLLPHGAIAGEVSLSFVNHIKAGLPELDVYLPVPFNGDQVMQIRPDGVDGRESQMLYASSEPIPHNPYDEEASGPFPKGGSLELSLGDWLGATGTATVGCTDEIGYVGAEFKGLVPDATYTLWYTLVPSPPTEPFTGALDLPLGARDGSNAALASDADGHAIAEISFIPCLEPSNGQIMSMLSLAWHSDGKTNGSSPGDFGQNSHVQVFAPIPIAERPES